MDRGGEERTHVAKERANDLFERRLLQRIRGVLCSRVQIVLYCERSEWGSEMGALGRSDQSSYTDRCGPDGRWWCGLGLRSEMFRKAQSETESLLRGFS